MVQVITLPSIAGWGLIFIGIAKDDNRFIGAGIVVMALTAIAAISYKLKTSGAKKSLERRIWREGTVATARVVDIDTRGGGMNDNPLVDFELEVSIEGEPPYTARVSTIIKKLRVPSIQPEMTIDVRVDPDDRANVVIDEKLVYLGYGD